MYKFNFYFFLPFFRFFLLVFFFWRGSCISSSPPFGKCSGGIGSKVKSEITSPPSSTLTGQITLFEANLFLIFITSLIWILRRFGTIANSSFTELSLTNLVFKELYLKVPGLKPVETQEDFALLWLLKSFTIGLNVSSTLFIGE